MSASICYKIVSPAKNINLREGECLSVTDDKSKGLYTVCLIRAKLGGGQRGKREKSH